MIKLVRSPKKRETMKRKKIMERMIKAEVVAEACQRKPSRRKTIL